MNKSLRRRRPQAHIQERKVWVLLFSFLSTTQPSNGCLLKISTNFRLPCHNMPRSWSDWIFWFRIRCTDVNKIFTPSKPGWQLRIRQIFRQTQLAVKGEAFSAFCSIVSFRREKVSKERGSVWVLKLFFRAVSIQFFVIIFGDKSRAGKVATSNP